MLKRIKCLITGHQFLMDNYPGNSRYYPRSTDKCRCCKKQRGKNGSQKIRGI